MVTETVKSAILARVLEYMEQHQEEGVARLEAAMANGKILYTTAEVMEMTGWGRSYILQLVNEGILPHLPGNPHRFLIAPLKQALYDLQTGGVFGRRKSKLKTRRK
ncbi:hypothetical protein [Oryzomonas rubra]|uniref:Helix-turn-helix domain-containing protein n=1 Tax=Oryzomonas rubra TaxID=2509454 RepID=A0A5A9X8A8_9BACT|nr:hypothetical protein [Oryzomonas rubra]KAA0888698.1 hypothetical protein ET418_15065 [Oryzomonas rubra]